MHVALIINPGSGSIDDPEDVVALLRDAGADEVTTFALGEEAAAAGSGADRLVVAGGDGTIAPSALAAADAGVPLGVLPAGTANDFARALGLPLDLGRAAAVALEPRRRVPSRCASPPTAGRSSTPRTPGSRSARPARRAD